MASWTNIFRAIQASSKYTDITSSWFPSHATATVLAKASAHSHRVAEIGRFTFRPLEGFSCKINTSGEGSAGLSSAQGTMTMSDPFGILVCLKSNITT
jgi:hypothetical protein